MFGKCVEVIPSSLLDLLSFSAAERSKYPIQVGFAADLSPKRVTGSHPKRSCSEAINLSLSSSTNRSTIHSDSTSAATSLPSSLMPSVSQDLYPSAVASPECHHQLLQQSQCHLSVECHWLRQLLKAFPAAIKPRSWRGW